jgi:DNA-binding NarL/FixJ family response regulator
MSAVLFLTSDLMFSSRVVGAARALGVPLQLVADPAVLPEKITAACRLVLVDLTLDTLNLSAAITAIRAAAPQARVVAYGPHVDHAALADAGQAGCDQVLSRGKFDQDYAKLLRAAAAPS